LAPNHPVTNSIEHLEFGHQFAALVLVEAEAHSVVVVETADFVMVVHPKVHLAMAHPCFVVKKLRCQISGVSLC
jgi:hypothetical protein